VLTKTNISVAVLIIFHLVGIGGVVFGDAQEFLQLTPLNLLLTALIIGINDAQNRFSKVFLVTYLLGFAIEVLGVNTGFPFGNYAYGSALGIKLLNTPLIIGLNWLILLYSTNAIAVRFGQTVVTKALVSAALMVTLDYLIEPVAISYDFWTWENGLPPFSNYAAWFIVAFIISAIWQMSRIKLNTRIAWAVYAVELFFFGILNLIQL
jgi:uncharacterized membrane protein